ncbi:MAG: dihydroorotate dehydrogenase electron transfer subunit [Lachnospiraceae bacterium]|jgi:dihydroorotate dehydrogenase electron transfer subunit|nr:dihydroorotate dehydrogenase electron transfer subunit [Lachnospiraceae bacterium]
MEVVRTELLAGDIWSTILRYPEELAPEMREARPGQFVGVYPKDGSRLLPRPISICRLVPEERTLRLVYRTVGAGTEEIAAMPAGSAVEVLGMLGNGYDTESMAGRRVVLLGGGLGIPPMLELAASLYGKAAPGSGQEVPSAAERKTAVTAVLGYRSAPLFLKEDFEASADAVYIATEDGSEGTAGNVLDAVRERGIRADVLCACGPLPMLRAVRDYAAEQGIPAYISLEEHMACGVGACLGCVVKTKHEDPHSHVKNARICTEGPVFPASEVEI